MKVRFAWSIHCSMCLLCGLALLMHCVCQPVLIMRAAFGSGSAPPGSPSSYEGGLPGGASFLAPPFLPRGAASKHFPARLVTKAARWCRRLRYGAAARRSRTVPCPIRASCRWSQRPRSVIEWRWRKEVFSKKVIGFVEMLGDSIRQNSHGRENSSLEIQRVQRNPLSPVES